MASRTQIVCLCEGAQGSSIDGVFINKLMRTLKPNWVRPEGSNVVRIHHCGGRSDLIKRTPTELKRCLKAGGHKTLMVWADCDRDCADGNALRELFWEEAKKEKVSRDQFDSGVFIFAKYRIENWIQFLATGNTNESEKGPRVKHTREAAEAAKRLALMCGEGRPVNDMPPSLQWSCKNWRKLVERMQTS